MTGLSRKIFILIAFILPVFAVLQGQIMGPQRVYQLSGLVVSRGDSMPIPYVTIQVNHSRRGMLTNSGGFYSLPVVETDTVWISCLGFKKLSFSVGKYLEEYPDSDVTPYLYCIHYLREDTVMMDTVKIYNYNSKEQLKTAILAMGVNPSLEEINARENMDPRLMATLMKNMDLDEGERMIVGRNIYYQQHQNAMKAPVLPLFDPVAAYMLLKYINDKAKKNRVKDLNYWNEN